MVEQYISSKDLLEKNIPKPTWLVQDIVQNSGLSTIAGVYKCSKTFFALYLAICVSKGLPVFNKETIKGRVLYIDEENGEIDMQDRVKRIMQGMDLKDVDIDFMIYKNIKLEHNKDKMRRNIHIKMLQDYIKDRQPVLIICDSMVRFMCGDENSAKDVREVFDFIKPFKKECAWLLLHHTPKSNTSDARGSGDWFGQCDEALIMDRIGKNKFKLKHKASRHNTWLYGEKYEIVGEENMPITFNYLGADEKMDEGKVSDTLGKLITKWYSDNELNEFKRQDVNKQFKKWAPSTITNALNLLCDDLVLDRSGKTKNTIYKVIG